MLSCPQKTDNSFVKFADDTYLVIPAASADTRVAELGHIAAWAAIWPSYMVKLWLSYMA